MILAFFCDSVGISHVLPNISRCRFFEPIFTSKKFDLYTSIYGIHYKISTIVYCLWIRIKYFNFLTLKNHVSCQKSRKTLLDLFFTLSKLSCTYTARNWGEADLVILNVILSTHRGRAADFFSDDSNYDG